MKCRTKEEWCKIIDGTKTAEQIARECSVNIATVYHAAKRFGLTLFDPAMHETEYRGIPLDLLKKELSSMPIGQVCVKYKLNETLLRNFIAKRNIEYVRVKRRSILEDQPRQDVKQFKRTGEAMDMIKTLLDFYTDASIARVFGYSRERIRQIRMEVQK